MPAIPAVAPNRAAASSRRCIGTREISSTVSSSASGGQAAIAWLIESGRSVRVRVCGVRIPSDSEPEEEPVSVLQRFEKRLEGLVEGAFAKVFKGVVHPVDILNAMQREAEAHKAILAGGRTLVPNRYVIDLSPYDHSRLAPYAAALAQELAQSQAEFIGEQGWTVYGDVIVEIERGDGLDTGMFRVTAEVYTGGDVAPVPSYEQPPPPAYPPYEQAAPPGYQQPGRPVSAPPGGARGVRLLANDGRTY